MAPAARRGDQPAHAVTCFQESPSLDDQTSLLAEQPGSKPLNHPPHQPHSITEHQPHRQVVMLPGCRLLDPSPVSSVARPPDIPRTRLKGTEPPAQDPHLVPEDQLSGGISRLPSCLFGDSNPVRSHDFIPGVVRTCKARFAHHCLMGERESDPLKYNLAVAGAKLVLINERGVSHESSENRRRARVDGQDRPRERGSADFRIAEFTRFPSSS